MEATLIQKYTTDLVNNLVRKIKTLSGLDHSLTKGEIREIFVSELLAHFLPEHLGIGTGIIINQASVQSSQTDIIIFDKRIFPSFLGKQTIGLYPVESVVGVIEVKSSCSKIGLDKCQKDFDYLANTIQNMKFQYRDKDKIRILKGFIAFNVKGFKSKEFDKLTIEQYSALNAICIENKFSVLKYKKRWNYSADKLSDHEEIKRFICWFIDNLRLISSERSEIIKKYRSWTSIYLRQEEKIRNSFKDIT